MPGDLKAEYGRWDEWQHVAFDALSNADKHVLKAIYAWDESLWSLSGHHLPGYKHELRGVIVDGSLFSAAPDEDDPNGKDGDRSPGGRRGRERRPPGQGGRPMSRPELIRLMDRYATARRLRDAVYEHPIVFSGDERKRLRSLKAAGEATGDEEWYKPVLDERRDLGHELEAAIRRATEGIAHDWGHRVLFRAVVAGRHMYILLGQRGRLDESWYSG